MPKFFIIRMNKDSSLATVATLVYSPHVAQQWTDGLLADPNASIMYIDISEVQ